MMRLAAWLGAEFRNHRGAARGCALAALALWAGLLVGPGAVDAAAAGGDAEAAAATTAAQATGAAGQPAWTLVLEDNFDRPVLGPNYLVLRGDWHINAQQQLQIQRQWGSHSVLMGNTPLRGQNVKLEIEAMIPAGAQAAALAIYLQAGALEWGGGGVDDRVGMTLKPTEEAAGGGDTLLVGKMHQIVVTLVDGRYRFEVDGVLRSSGAVVQGRSLVNSGLELASLRGAMFDNLRIYTAAMARPLPAVAVQDQAANRQATVDAGPFIDAGKPDCGIQGAIDALPAGGGVVLLPKGTFLLRRFLDLPSHTTLAGQGPETVLACIDATATAVVEIRPEGAAWRVLLAGPHDFRPGDSFSYDRCWGHPINARKPGETGPPMLSGGEPVENRLLVLAVEEKSLLVNCPPASGKAASVVHFFPPICSYQSEWTQVRDLRIVGPANNPGGASGGFQTNPITFGVTSHPRFTRLLIEKFPADGISAQGCDDGRFFDNTIAGVAKGMHPGTVTLRTMVARNLSVDNGTGLFFCWYNSNGVYFRNLVKDFTGYADAGDVFNTIACNRLTQAMQITVGYNGCLFANEMPGLVVFRALKAKETASSPAILGPGGRSYDLPPRYFTIGANQIDTLKHYAHATGNVLAGNYRGDGQPTALPLYEKENEPSAAAPSQCVLAPQREQPLLTGLPEPISRSEPAPPPALPTPVLDGREFYEPQSPDQGFQKALDQLAAKGGTLLLPGGRYGLSQSLKVPSNVTLAGQGTGTVLLPVGQVQSLIVFEAAQQACVRELAIEGDFTGQATRGPAVAIRGGEGVSVIALDIRGWSGDGLLLAGKGVVVEDCRVLRSAGVGYQGKGAQGLICRTSSAVYCGSGFVLEDCPGAGLEGNIAALNAGSGYRIRSDGVLVTACNANNNRGDGFLVEQCQRSVLAGNTAAGNNQGGTQAAGIRLGSGAQEIRVLYNNCGDEQLYATQLVGIRLEAGADQNEVSRNATATVAARRGHEEEPSLIDQGKQNQVSDNSTATILPSNDSLETIQWQGQQAGK